MANFREFLGKNTIFNEHLLHADQLWVLLALTLRHFPVEWLLSVQGDHPNIQDQRKKKQFSDFSTFERVMLENVLWTLGFCSIVLGSVLSNLAVLWIILGD